ncbi:type II secretion system F family protein [Escherichia coli]
MASKQLWRWHGITGDGNAQDGMLWAESRALLLMALQQRMVTPLSLKRIAINSAQWRGDKSAEVIHQLATLLKAGLTLVLKGWHCWRNSIHKQWQALLRSLAHDLKQGIAFSNALLPWSEVFPPLYQAMIRTGELSR